MDTEGSFRMGASLTRWPSVQPLRLYQPRRLSGVGDPWPSIERVREHGVDDQEAAIEFAARSLDFDNLPVAQALVRDMQ